MLHAVPFLLNGKGPFKNYEFIGYHIYILIYFKIVILFSGHNVSIIILTFFQYC